MRLIYTIFFGCLCFSQCTTKNYQNYTLFRGIPVTEEHLAFLKNVSEVYKAKFWRFPGLTYRPVEFIVSPEKKKKFLRDAISKGIYFTTIMEDVQKAFDSQTVKSYVRRNMDSFDWSSFFNLADIYEWLQDLNQMHPKEMHLESIGKTYKNRDILAARIFLSGGKENRPKVIVEGGIHSREWISIAFVTYFLNQILNTVKAEKSKLKSIALEYEWFFVPVLNPDGYEYTHTTDRMYRKNMRGVDLNRNFDIHFGSVGTSSNRQSETYCGPSAFSEVETKAMADFVTANSKNLKYYIAFHSYGQYMIIPYTHSKKHEENFDEAHEMGTKAAIKISKRYGTQYTVGTAYDTVGYVTSGVSGCWAKRSFSIPYVFTFELRDEGHHGFALPPHQILPTCYETMDGLIYLLGHDLRNEDDLILKHNAMPIKSGQEKNILDSFVVLWNVLFFIIKRFEYTVVLFCHLSEIIGKGESDSNEFIIIPSFISLYT